MPYATNTAGTTTAPLKPLEIPLTLTAELNGTATELATAVISPRFRFDGTSVPKVDLNRDLADALEEMAKELRGTVTV